MSKRTVTPRILFVHGYARGQLASFIQQDLALLQEMYPVEELPLSAITMRQGPLGSPVVWKAVGRADVVFAWFGNTSAPVVIIARLLGRRSLLVAGGMDVVSIPEISYGLGSARRRRRWIILLGFRWATRVLLFSESSRSSLLSLPGIRADNLQTLYLGVDTEHFRPEGAKKPQVLSVGYINVSNLRRKGLQTFVEASKRTPEIPFRLAGRLLEHNALDTLKAIAGPNVAFLGYLDDDQLLVEYQQALTYAQLSMHEGFGMALAEAMACACVPIVTDRGAIPEVVGDTGIYVPLEDAEAAAEAIRSVVADPGSQIVGRRARQRILELFPISNRREGLRAAIERVISGK